MSKSKNHSSELEQLRQELKSCKAETRHLRKQLARASKNQSRLQDLEELAKDQGLQELIEYETKLDFCPDCKGKMTKMGGKEKILHQVDCPQRKRR